MRYEIIFSGSGGQGMILSGIITAEAAAVFDKINAVQTQSYSPEARGGMTEAYVILSENETIDYPEITHPDVIIALSQAGLDRQKRHLNKDTVIIIDSKNVKADTLIDNKYYSLPLTEISEKIMQKSISANIVALGALTAFTQKIRKESMLSVIEKRVPKTTVDANKQCFLAGYEQMLSLMYTSAI